MPCRRAQPGGRFDQCVEYRLQIEGRAADDFEHVRGRRLLLQHRRSSVRWRNSLSSRVFSMAMTA